VTQEKTTWPKWQKNGNTIDLKPDFMLSKGVFFCTAEKMGVLYYPDDCFIN